MTGAGVKVLRLCEVLPDQARADDAAIMLRQQTASSLFGPQQLCHTCGAQGVGQACDQGYKNGAAQAGAE